MTSIRHKTPDPEPVVTTLSVATGAGDDAYLDAAREAILAVGWSRTTLTDIARRAGVSRMTLYRRWPDMQTMLADLMTREWSRAVGASQALFGPGAGPRATVLDQLAQGIVTTVRTLRENDLLRRIIELDAALLLPYLLERRGRSQHHVAGLVAGLVRAGQAEGSVRAGEPDLLARSLLLACHGFTLSAHTMVDPPSGGARPDRDADVSAFDDELARLVERYLRP